MHKCTLCDWGVGFDLEYAEHMWFVHGERVPGFEYLSEARW